VLNRLRWWVVDKTITYAESRYSIFVWMRQVNGRLIRLEKGQAEQAVQEKAEAEIEFDAKLQKAEAKIDQLQSEMEGLRAAILEDEDNGV